MCGAELHFRQRGLDVGSVMLWYDAAASDNDDDDDDRADVLSGGPARTGRPILSGLQQSQARSSASLCDAADHTQRYHVDRDAVRRRDTRLSHVVRSRDRKVRVVEVSTAFVC